MNNHLILGIETSGIRCSVAWWQNGSVLLEFNLEKKNEHAVLLPAFIEKGFEELEIEPKSVTHVVIGSGPGSFTGLRIGMSYAKGFCFGHNIPLIPVTNFELLSALAEENDFPVFTLIEAGRGNYYTGIFNQSKSELDDKFLLSDSQLKEKIPDNGQIVIHEENSKGYLTKFLGRTTKVVEGQYSAARLCDLGFKKYPKGPHQNLAEIEPQYLQAFAGVT
jgi:tRNA threonylcarbamoyladenosine biosynthesis protein TsaB